jgi:hypothetical protein
MEESAESIPKWVEASEHELAELEKQSYRWWGKAHESSGHLNRDYEKIARSVDARVIELRSELARRRDKLEKILHGEGMRG